MKTTLVSALINTSKLIDNYKSSDHTDWAAFHEEKLAKLCRDHLPRGIGVFGVSVAATTDTKAVFYCLYRHTDKHGYFVCNTAYRIVVRPTFTGLAIRVLGRNKYNVKEYLADQFRDALERIVDC